VDVSVASDDVEGAEAAAADFEAWVASRAPGLVRFAYLVTGSQDAADEAVQAALAKACEHWQRISRMSNRDAYVRRMIVNAHISWWRKFRKRESPVAVVLQPAYTDDLATGMSTDDAVWRLCSTLPTRQRAAVVLRYYEDLSYPEIAAVLDCPEATARSYIHRALAALRRTLAEEEHTE
jgi:RNA polymerase sigma-70 factor (sigma-E family)